MTYGEALAAMIEGHAVVRKSWNLPDVCIVKFSDGGMTWLDGHKVLRWRPSEECVTATDWVLADEVRERDRQTRKATVAALSMP